MTPATYALLRWSLVFVWLATAIVSVVELNGQSRALLVSLPPAWSSIAGLAPFLILAGAAALVANGEIYNYRELRSDHALPAATASDCEPPLHLYRRDGAGYGCADLRGRRELCAARVSGCA